MTFREAFTKELIWHKKAIIVQTCHLTRRIQLKKWKMKDTARELGISLSHVSEDLKLAEMIDRDNAITQLSRNRALKELG